MDFDFTEKRLAEIMKSNHSLQFVIQLGSDLAALTKIRVNLLVAATAFVGFALHVSPSKNWRLLVATLGGPV